MIHLQWRERFGTQLLNLHFFNINTSERQICMPFTQYEGCNIMRSYVLSSVRLFYNKKCAIMYYEQMPGARSATFCTHAHWQATFACQFSYDIKIINIPDPQFESQRFESSTLGSANMVISDTVTDRTNIAIANTKLHVTFRLAYLHSTLAQSKDQGQDHSHYDC